MRKSQAIARSAMLVLAIGLAQCPRAHASSTLPVSSMPYVDTSPVESIFSDLSLSLSLFETPNSNQKNLCVDLNAWIWAMGIDGDIGAGARTSSVDASFVDVLETSDSLIGIAGRLEVGRGGWAVFVDGIYNKIGIDDMSGPIGLADIDVTAEMGLVDSELMLRIRNWRIDRISNDA